VNGPPAGLHVLVAGGGVAGLETVLALRASTGNDVAIEVLAPESEFVYRPQAVADPFRVGETRRFPLPRLVEAAGAALRRGALQSVDPGAYVAVTDDGTALSFDALVVAVGAKPRVAVPGALTFAGPASADAVAALLGRTVEGGIRRIVFAVPGGCTWPLPLYELALLTNAFLVEHDTIGIEIEIVTPEQRPLALFGEQASDALADLLEIRGIAFRGETTPVRFVNGILRLAPDQEVETDAVVALPRLQGPGLAGLPHDRDGFIPTDAFARVDSEPDVYAVGDATQFPLKQGGIATQQADVAAAHVATRAGGPPPRPFRPVLRGLLLTGMAPRFLRAEPGTPRSLVDTEPLWWPPAKIVGRHLAPFLADELGLSARRRDEPDAVPVEIELDPAGHPVWAPV
jgi:sulfide:quinone oxidoreductase